MKKMINIFLSCSLVFSTNAFAIDLQILPKNTNKNHFLTINDPFETNSNLAVSYSSVSNPLIFKRSDGSISTLVNSLQVFELSMFYKLSNKVQLGLLIPGEKVSGILGPYEEAKSYLGNILIEPKIYFSENLAFIPVYYVPQSNSITTQINNSKTKIETSKNTAYGAKLVAGFGDSKSTAYALQVGAIIAPEETFRDIDQKERFQIGGGISYPVNDSIKLLIEAYSEKSNSSSQLEALTSLQYNNKSMKLTVSSGSGDILSKDSNKGTISASISYQFEDKKELAANHLTNSDDFLKRYNQFSTKKELVDDKKIEKTSEEIEETDSLEEERGPSTSRSPGDKIENYANRLMIEPKKIKISKINIPFVPKEKPIDPVIPNTVAILDRKRIGEIGLKIEIDYNPNLDKNKKIRSIASEDFNSVPSRAKNNIKNAINLLTNNLYLYQKFSNESKLEKAEKAKIEIKWAIRVFQRNIAEINEKDLFVLEAENKIKLAKEILNDKNKDLFGSVKIINTSRVILKTADIEDNDVHFLTILPKNSEILVINDLTFNEYIQIKPVSGRFSNYEFPIYILKRYVSEKNNESIVVSEEEVPQINTIKEIKALESILEEKVNQRIYLLEELEKIDLTKREEVKQPTEIKENINVLNQEKVEENQKEKLVNTETSLKAEEVRENSSNKIDTNDKNNIEIVSFDQESKKDIKKEDKKIEVVEKEIPKIEVVEKPVKIEEKKEINEPKIEVVEKKEVIKETEQKLDSAVKVELETQESTMSDLKIESPKVEMVKENVDPKMMEKLEKEIEKKVEDRIRKELEEKIRKEMEEKERIEKLKKEEMIKIDKFFELKDGATIQKEEKKEVIKQEVKEKSKFQELIDKSNQGLGEEDGMETQSGPSFEE